MEETVDLEEEVEDQLCGKRGGQSGGQKLEEARIWWWGKRNQPKRFWMLEETEVVEESVKKRWKRSISTIIHSGWNRMNLTSVDLFFGTKDPIEKLTVEVRPMELGTPTGHQLMRFHR